MKILILYANRAEKSILDPVYHSICAHASVDYVNLSKEISNIHLDKNLSKVYDWTFSLLSNTKYDKLVVLGDRREITFACLAAFIKQVPLVQLASGDKSSSLATVDDYFRHIITIMSQKQLAFSIKSLLNTQSLFSSIGGVSNVNVVANPTFSNIDLNSLTQQTKEPYDLILVHPQSLSRADTLKDAQEVRKLITPDKKNVIISGNKDKNYEILENLWDSLGGSIETVDKDTFLSYIKYCDRFITNSSCSYYEAPLILEEKKIVRIGNRNKGREIVKYEEANLHSSSRIAKIIIDV
jgi:UDP-N-acetylglucosamine 2-epimerase